jgi:glycine/D-amino acid oxidase-like deaminating enzyme
MGSTAASTSLLQYELDVPMHQLAAMYGLKIAERCYHLCREAIYNLRQIAGPANWQPCPSLQYASAPAHLDALRKEFSIRKQAGFDLQWLDPADLRQLYGFTAPGALLSADGATTNSYLLTCQILNSISASATVCINTPVTSIEENGNAVLLTTANGHTIQARHAIIACGYEALRYIKVPGVRLQTTYAIATEPLSGEKWYRDSMIWETRKPYLYLRTTSDNRVLAGGFDEAYTQNSLLNKVLQAKAMRIGSAVHNLFPHFNMPVDFYWGGLFVTTRDGMPYIGQLPGKRNIYYSLGYGGNGITFSLIAAQLIADSIAGVPNRDLNMFSLNR